MNLTGNHINIRFNATLPALLNCASTAELSSASGAETCKTIIITVNFWYFLVMICLATLHTHTYLYQSCHIWVTSVHISVKVFTHWSNWEIDWNLKPPTKETLNQAETLLKHQTTSTLLPFHSTAHKGKTQFIFSVSLPHIHSHMLTHTHCPHLHS